MPPRNFTAVTLHRRVNEKAKVLGFITGQPKAGVIEAALDLYEKHFGLTMDVAKAAAITARNKRAVEESEPALK